MVSDTMSSAGSSPMVGLITHPDFTATSAFRVFHTVEILQNIASSLPKKSILSLMLSSFHAFEVALREYWRSADVRSVEHLVERDCTPQRVAQYCCAVKTLTYQEGSFHPNCLMEFGLDDCEGCYEMPDFTRYISNFPNARNLSIPRDELEPEPAISRQYNISCARQDNIYGRSSTIASGVTLALLVQSGDHIFDNLKKIPYELEYILQTPEALFDISELKMIELTVSQDTNAEDVSCLLHSITCNTTFLLLRSIDVNVYTDSDDVILLVETYGNIDGRNSIIECLTLKCVTDKDLFGWIALSFPALTSLRLIPAGDSTPVPLSFVMDVVNRELPNLDTVEIGISCKTIPSLSRKLRLHDVRSPKLILKSLTLHVANIPSVPLFDIATYLCRRISTQCQLKTQVWLKDVAGAVGDRPSVEQLKLWEKMVNLERRAVTELAGANHSWYQIKKSKKRSRDCEA